MKTLYTPPERAVLKIGTASITPKVIAELARQMAEIREHVRELVLVSSGAVQYGRINQGAKKHPGETVEDKKFFASVGQPLLIAAYTEALEKHGISVAQALVTWDDFDSKERCKKLKGVLDRSFHSEKPTLPILNENDVTADEEFTGFTDNDHLAAEVAGLMDAQKILFLSRTNGVRRQLDDARSRIAVVEYGDKRWKKYVGKSTSGNGKGGMRNKCETAARLSGEGREVVIASARIQDVAMRVLLQGERIGTTFLPSEK
jgi:glutamate 5-kinase